MALARIPRSSLFAALAALPLAVGCGPGADLEEPLPPDFSAALKETPAGSHYNLNIIGVPKGKSANLTGGDGRRIFVPLYGKTNINLSEGPDFKVLDANGTDGSAAYQMPNPDPDNDGRTTYSVYARALGKPGGSSSMTTCATDPTTGETYCSIYSAVFVRDSGKSSWSNVTRELLYCYVDMDGDGQVERYPLFDDSLEDYYWAYDNNGLKNLQLRFYEQMTDVN